MEKLRAAEDSIFDIKYAHVIVWLENRYDVKKNILVDMISCAKHDDH